MRLVARVFLISFFLMIASSFVAVYSLGAQENQEATAPSLVPGDQEGKDYPAAPTFLKNLTADSPHVDLVWNGYWRISLMAGGNFGKINDKNIFPGFRRGVAFLQEPDVTISLWLYNRWFIETSFIEGFERNTYRAGYVGEEGEFVQEVTVGNTGVNADSYAGIAVPKPRYNTPGAVAKFSTPKSEHEILVRFDPTENSQKTYQGEYEVHTQEIGLPEFVEGQYFILPDTSVSNIALYLEDQLGSVSGTDGLGNPRRYRRAEAVEFFIDAANGLLELNEPHDGQVVVYYDVGGTAVGDSSLGQNFIVPADANFHPDFKAWGGDENNLLNFNWDVANPYDSAGRDYDETSRVSIGGKKHLILYSPGRFTPFERQNAYKSSRPLPQETWRIRALLRDRGALYPSSTPEFRFIPDIDNKTIAVYSQVGENLRYPSNRYPFAGADPDIYGIGRETDPHKISRTILLAIRESNPGYYLGPGVVSDSAIIRVNGAVDKTAKISEDGHIIFSRFIYPEDWIEVSFRTEVLGFSGGDLFVYQGNHFQLTPFMNLELAENVRWNISPKRTVEEYEQSPGQIELASTLNWERDKAGLRIAGDTMLSTPDTAGNLRLFGMDRGGMGLAFHISTLVRSPSSFTGAPTGTRKKADQYNYLESDVLGRETLKDYTWSGAKSSGKDGPALANSRRDDPISGRVMELRLNLTSNGEWTSGDFLADPSGPINFSRYSAIEFPIRFLGNGLGTNEPKIILMAGEIGESQDHHLDGTVNKLDAGAKEEWDFSTDKVVWSSGNLSDAWTSGKWRTVRIALTPAMRAKLESVRSFRLLVESNSTNAISGRIVMGAPEFAGSPFRTEIRDSTDKLPTPQNVGGDTVTDNTLKTSFDEVAKIFHPNGENNNALRIRWGDKTPGGSDIANNERWESVSWFADVPLSGYRTLVFYVRDKEGIGDISASASDEKGRGIRVSWKSESANASSSGWDRITVNISEGRAYSARGNTITSIAVDSNAKNLTRFLLKGTDAAGSVSSSDRSGEVYLDEIHFKDPAYIIAGAAELQGFWRHEEDIATIGNFPMLGDISLTGRSEVSGGKVLSGIDRGNTAYGGAMSAEAVLMGAKLNTDWRGKWNPRGSLAWSGSHNLRIPARNTTFWMNESYTRSVASANTTFSRLNDANLSLSPWNIRIYTKALYDGVSLVQTWGGVTSWLGKRGEANLDIRYVQSSAENTGQPGDYFTSWMRNYTLIAPAKKKAIDREAHHLLNTVFHAGSISVAWRPSLRIKATQAPEWSQVNQWQGIISVPMTFTKWSITPSYRRNLKQVMKPNADHYRDYNDLWRNYTSGLAKQFPLFTYLPFRELFGSSDGEAFARVTRSLKEARYESDFSIDMRRSTESRILDLFVPSNAHLSMERRYSRKGDTTGWENEWRASLGFRASTLFGQFGQYPVIPFYNNEDLNSLFQITMMDFNGTTVPDPEELTWQLNWIFAGIRNRRLVIDNRLLWNWNEKKRETNQEGRLEYHWQTPSKDVLHLPLIKRAIPRRHHLENKERFTATGLYPWKNALESSKREFAFTFYHESRWVFEDIGHFKGWLTFGMGERNALFINGWELGLEVEFRF